MVVRAGDSDMTPLKVMQPDVVILRGVKVELAGQTILGGGAFDSVTAARDSAADHAHRVFPSIDHA
jgi:hypothetical protein